MDRELSELKKEIIEELKQKGELNNDKGQVDEEAVKRHTQREQNIALINLAKKHRIIGKDK